MVVQDIAQGRGHLHCIELTLIAARVTALLWGQHLHAVRGVRPYDYEIDNSMHGVGRGFRRLLR